MAGNNTKRTARPWTLDALWRARGSAFLRREFARVAKSDREEAARLLRDDNNSFPVIYILAPVIESLDMTELLPERAAEALCLTAEKCGERERACVYRKHAAGCAEMRHETLRWMILTGAGWDGPSSGRDSFDAAIDAASAHLADKHDDPECFSALADLMFRRNRRGLNVHDLAWGFFRTADPGTLVKIAKRLLSDNAADVELTCRLMGFDDPGTRDGRRRLLEEYMAWLEEHRPYLYATGEHFNSTSVPYHVRHDREAKFMKREIHPRDRTPKKPLTPEEYQVLLAHRENARGEKEGLS